MQKLYWVHCPELGFPYICFADEGARNELTLAIWQEYMYCLEMRIINWYDEPIMSGIDEDASNNVETWESEVL
jgi:hypothetical protein